MLGTVVNAAAIFIGGAVGLFLRSGLKEKYKEIVTQAIALAVLFVGASGAIVNMMKDGANPILFIISLAFGALLGEWMGIEKALERFGGFLESKLIKNKGESDFSQGFVATSLLFCVGTMAILGAIESGTQNNHTILYAKSILDGITSVVLASTFGFGVLFSAASVLVYQGSLTMLAVWVSPYLTDDMLREISIVGGIVIFAIGLNMLKITKIKVGNMLPALFIPVIYYLLLWLVK